MTLAPKYFIVQSKEKLKTENLRFLLQGLLILKSSCISLNFFFTNKQVNVNNSTFCFQGTFFWAPITVNRYETRSRYGPASVIFAIPKNRFTLRHQTWSGNTSLTKNLLCNLKNNQSLVPGPFCFSKSYQLKGTEFERKNKVNFFKAFSSSSFKISYSKRISRMQQLYTSHTLAIHSKIHESNIH